MQSQFHDRMLINFGRGLARWRRWRASFPLNINEISCFLTVPSGTTARYLTTYCQKSDRTGANRGAIALTRQLNCAIGRLEANWDNLSQTGFLLRTKVHWFIFTPRQTKQRRCKNSVNVTSPMQKDPHCHQLCFMLAIGSDCGHTDGRIYHRLTRQENSSHNRRLVPSWRSVC